MSLIALILACQGPDAGDKAKNKPDTGEPAACVAVREICGNEIDEDCDGVDPVCLNSLNDAFASWEGASAEGWSGDVLAALGDVDGDGQPDFAVGSKGVGDLDGEVSIVTNHTAGAARSLSNTWAGFTTSGDDADQFGTAIAGLVERDRTTHHGYAIGAAMAERGVGSVYLLTGPASQGTVDLSLEVDNTDLVQYVGPMTGSLAGHAVAFAGFLDGDDHPDLVVGARRASESGDYRDDQGAAYILFGPFDRDAGEPQTRSLDLEGTTIWGGGNGHSAGCAVAGLGDVDGDGLAEVAVSACDAGNNSGAVFLVDDSSDHRLAADPDFALMGEQPGDHAGVLVQSAGDADGDGNADVLVMAHSCGFDLQGCANQNFGRSSWYILTGARLEANAASFNMSLSLAWTRVTHPEQDNHYSCRSAAVGDFAGADGPDLAIGGCWESAGGVHVLPDMLGGSYEAPSEDFTVLSGVSEGDLAGAELAVVGNSLIIGAWAAGTDPLQAGAVYAMPAGSF